MKALLYILITLLLASPVYGQADKLIYSSAPDLTFQPPKKEKVIDTEFIAVSSYLVLMTIFDVETTFAAIRNGAEEANPIMKPFVKNGRVATYAIQLTIDAAVIFLAYEMKSSKNKTFGKTWWVIPSVVGTAHGIAGGLNCRYIW